MRRMFKNERSTDEDEEKQRGRYRTQSQEPPTQHVEYPSLDEDTNYETAEEQRINTIQSMTKSIISVFRRKSTRSNQSSKSEIIKDRQDAMNQPVYTTDPVYQVTDTSQPPVFFEQPSQVPVLDRNASHQFIFGTSHPQLYSASAAGNQTLSTASNQQQLSQHPPRSPQGTNEHHTRRRSRDKSGSPHPCPARMNSGAHHRTLNQDSSQQAKPSVSRHSRKGGSKHSAVDATVRPLHNSTYRPLFVRVDETITCHRTPQNSNVNIKIHSKHALSTGKGKRRKKHCKCQTEECSCKSCKCDTRDGVAKQKSKSDIAGVHCCPTNAVEKEPSRLSHRAKRYLSKISFGSQQEDASGRNHQPIVSPLLFGRNHHAKESSSLPPQNQDATTTSSGRNHQPIISSLLFGRNHHTKESSSLQNQDATTTSLCPIKRHDSPARTHGAHRGASSLRLTRSFRGHGSPTSTSGTSCHRAGSKNPLTSPRRYVSPPVNLTSQPPNRYDSPTRPAPPVPGRKHSPLRPAPSVPPRSRSILKSKKSASTMCQSPLTANQSVPQICESPERSTQTVPQRTGSPVRQAPTEPPTKSQPGKHQSILKHYKPPQNPCLCPDNQPPVHQPPLCPQPPPPPPPAPQVEESPVEFIPIWYQQAGSCSSDWLDGANYYSKLQNPADQIGAFPPKVDVETLVKKEKKKRHMKDVEPYSDPTLKKSTSKKDKNKSSDAKSSKSGSSMRRGRSKSRNYSVHMVEASPPTMWNYETQTTSSLETTATPVFKKPPKKDPSAFARIEDFYKFTRQPKKTTPSSIYNMSSVSSGPPMRPMDAVNGDDANCCDGVVKTQTYPVPQVDYNRSCTCIVGNCACKFTPCLSKELAKREAILQNIPTGTLNTQTYSLQQLQKQQQQQQQQQQQSDYNRPCNCKIEDCKCFFNPCGAKERGKRDAIIRSAARCANPLLMSECSRGLTTGSEHTVGDGPDRDRNRVFATTRPGDSDYKTCNCTTEFCYCMYMECASRNAKRRKARRKTKAMKPAKIKNRKPLDDDRCIEPLEKPINRCMRACCVTWIWNDREFMRHCKKKPSPLPDYADKPPSLRESALQRWWSKQYIYIDEEDGYGKGLTKLCFGDGCKAGGCKN